MRVAALYDIHANLPALEAVLHHIREFEVDLIVVGGDVFPGPMPRETMDCLLGLDIPAKFILGNGDREVRARMHGLDTEWYRAAREEWREPVRWCAEQLGPLDERSIAGWPKMVAIEISGLGNVLFCHATPRNDVEIFTRLTPEDRLLPVFGGLDASAAVCGHTHMQFDRCVGKVRVLNAGSVGMPFGTPGAYWLLFGPDARLMHTPYNLEKAAERIRETHYPGAEHFAAHNVLQPPSEEETLKAFTRGELR